MRRPPGRKKRGCPGEEGEDKKKEEEMFRGEKQEEQQLRKAYAA